MTRTYREPPPLVKQLRDKVVLDGKVFQQNDCWLAALISWRAVTWGQKIKGDADLVTRREELHAKYKGSFNENTYVMEEAALVPMLRFNENMYVWDKSKLKTQTLDYNFFAARLRFGSILLGYATLSHFGHVVVVYGAEQPTSGEAYLAYMDPWEGAYERDPISYFTKQGVMAIGWLFV